MGGFLLQLPHMPSFPPKPLPSWSWASSIMSQGGQGARWAGSISQSPPGGPPLPRPDSGAGRHLGAAFGCRHQGDWAERGRSPAACQARGHPGPARKELERRSAGSGCCCLGPPERVSTSRYGSPGGVGPLMGLRFSQDPAAQPGGCQLTLSSRTDKRPPSGCPARPAYSSGSAGAGFPTAAAHGQAWRSPLPPPPRPAGRAGSERRLPALSAVPVCRRAGTQGLPVHLLSPQESSHPCSAPRGARG